MKTYSCHEVAFSAPAQRGSRLVPLGVFIKQSQTVCFVPYEGHQGRMIEFISEQASEAQRSRKVKAFWDKCFVGSAMLNPYIITDNCIDLKFDDLEAAKEAVQGGLKALMPEEEEAEIIFAPPPARVRAGESDDEADPEEGHRGEE